MFYTRIFSLQRLTKSDKKIIIYSTFRGIIMKKVLWLFLIVILFMPTLVNAENINVVIKVNSYLNVREAASSDSRSVGKLYNNNVVRVDNNKKSGKGCSKGWYKITSGTYNGKYICSNYTVVKKTEEPSGGNQTSTNGYPKVVHTTGSVRLRSKPTTSSSILKTLGSNKNFVATSIVKAKNSGCKSNHWVKLTSNSTTGYACSSYIADNATTDKYIYSCDNTISNNRVAIKRNGSDSNKIPVRRRASSNANVLAYVNPGSIYNYEASTNSFYKISINGTYGYVSKNYSMYLASTDTYAEIDLSDQIISFYKDGTCMLKASTVTGKYNPSDKAVNTRKGAYTISEKTINYYFRDSNVYSNYWMRFDNGIGIHDADNWRSSYGYKGSHGCVNVPLSAGKKIYDNATIGTKVIVHE